MMRVNVMESLGILALLPLRVLGRCKETIAINCLNSQPILIFDQTMYMKPSALNRTVTNWFPIKSFIIQLPTSAQVACGLFFLDFSYLRFGGQHTLILKLNLAIIQSYIKWGKFSSKNLESLPSGHANNFTSLISL